MDKLGQGMEPSAPLPTAPPPPYDATFPQPAYNPQCGQINIVPPPHVYQAVPVIHERPTVHESALAQASPSPYPNQTYHPPPVQVRENTVVIGVPLMVGPQSLQTTCPNCQSSIKTRTSKESRGLAHLFCLALCLFGCCLCSCIPYCLDSLKEVHHTCPKCKAHLGTYRN